MREIKFRGKRIDNGEWVYGDLVQNPCSTRIVVDFVLIDGCNDGTVECGGDFYLVDPRTVGQFTGLQDSKGVDIYEGDLVNCVGLPSGKIGNARKMLGKVVQRTMGWTICVKYKKEWWHYSKMSYLKEELEVIGNIHTEVKK